MTLGEKIQALRKQKGLSQEQLSEKMSVTRQAVSKWELDETNPDLDNIVQISNIFDVSIDYLLGKESATSRKHTIHDAKIEPKPKRAPIIKCVAATAIIFGLGIIAYYFMIMPMSPLRRAVPWVMQFSWLAFVVAGIVSLIVCWIILDKQK
ncbi:MAG: helix-turn-helix domain-containing protein [Defluviitaleaceae bacterium]|nr:helix-turn-helix domain-containing protein [Defluviitaleaceae bacterium]